MRLASRAVLIVIVWLLLLSRAEALLPINAEPMDEQTRQLLEKSLSVVELDREIDRISKLRVESQASIDQTQHKLDKQEVAIAAQREQAGRVLRAYYMGHKDFWLNSILVAKSLPDLIRAWDLMDMVMQSDQRAMDSYAEEYKNLRDGYDQLKRNKADLDSVSKQLIEQRARITALQKEVDGALAASGDADMLRKLMDELQAYWKNVGLYEVKQHFKALADAMHDLPTWVKETPGMLSTSGLKAKLTITDQQLNDFLRSKDDRFKDFAFTFDNGMLTMNGDNGNIKVMIQGRYEVVNDPENAIIFHVDKLVFNGLELPDTTREDLEREFDLGFYPQKLIKYVKAQSVTLEDGKLVVALKIG
ncbi:coiled-coil domain-containing protein [Cohnella yongneupensis]|uniref:Coiled-coil domain-containing protein n=1 Tax=Cohnella yongneupensis TaxID=425006 RepID=A0ABW0R9W9_9BACL